jgi:hypothetical protein
MVSVNPPSDGGCSSTGGAPLLTSPRQQQQQQGSSSGLGMAMALPGTVSSPTAAAAAEEDPSKKVRKPYTITKSRESWTEQEHDKFLEALQLYGLLLSLSI